jgi:uncharacterized protein YrzB (UPF0473 family)
LVPRVENEGEEETRELFSVSGKENEGGNEGDSERLVP